MLGIAGHVDAQHGPRLSFVADQRHAHGAVGGVVADLPRKRLTLGGAQVYLHLVPLLLVARWACCRRRHRVAVRVGDIAGGGGGGSVLSVGVVVVTVVHGVECQVRRCC
jgi:hypothetical protein